ncbi:MAG: hypothetical protein GYA24_21485 [Candidatus Lokiarchaeota archaeon]|nr:hypothetical protein [Candidatus Lokiarchaeota archaeon]
MISDTALKPLLFIHVGAFSPPIIKHFKALYLAGGTGLAASSVDAARKILINFVNFRREKISIKPAPKEIIVSLYNTLKLVSEHVLSLHKEKYDETTEHLLANEVERAWVLNVKKPVPDEMHEDLLWIEKTRDACVMEGANPIGSDLLLFENKVKHLLRGFVPAALPGANG